MSEASSNDVNKLTKKDNNDPSEAIGLLSATSNNSPSLSNMPIDVVGLVIDRSDYKQQLKLRKVCKTLRSLVDKQKPALLLLYIICRPGSIRCYYNRECAHYDSPNGNSVKDCVKFVKCRVMVSDNYEKMAFDDIAFTLKNPKLRLKVVNFDVQNVNEFARLREILESIGHQLSARDCNVEISRPSEYRSILPYFKPGVLKKITVSYSNQGDVLGSEDTALETLKQVSLLEQWKQAEELDYLNVGYQNFPMEYAKHFKTFFFREAAFDLNLLNGYKDLILTMDNFEFCEIQAHIPLYEDEFRYMWKRVGVPAAPNDRTQYVSHYSIPNSEDILEFMFFIHGNVVIIEKKNRSKAMEELAAENSKNSSKPSLSDLPDNVLELIIQKSDYMEQLILRKTSKSLLALVDEQKPALTRLKIYSDSGFIQCHYNDDEKFYAKPDCYELRMDYGEESEAVIWSEDYEEIAFKDLAFTLKNPKLLLESLSIDFANFTEPEDNDEYGYHSDFHYDKLCDILESRDHLLPVKKYNLDISSPYETHSILSYLEPVVLEKITVRYGNLHDKHNDGTALDTLKEEVLLLEQWKQAKELDYLDLYTNSDFIKIGFNENTAIYACPGTYAYEAEPDVTCEPIVRDDYEKIAFDDLAFALKNPRLKLNYFGAQFESFDTYQIDYSNLKKILVSNTHNLKVRSCQVWIYSPRRYCDILQYLEPGFLEKIQVSYFMAEHDPYGESSLDSLKKIVLLEQWKQAKELELSEVEFDDFPMEYAEHFRRFRFSERKIDSHLLLRIRNYLSKLNNFEFCLIKSRVSFSSEALRLLCWTVGHQAAPIKRTKYVSHHSIPNSDDFLEFKFFMRNSTITIEKRKKTDNDQYKNKASTPSKSLSDLPLDLLALIIEKSKYKEQLILRKVSKSLRQLVDRQKPACKSIQVECWDGIVPTYFNNHCVFYADELYESEDDEEDDENDDDEPAINVVRDDFMKVAFDDLASTLKNPKLQLEEFSFFVHEDTINSYEKIQCALESLNHQVSVKSIDLRMSSLSCFLSVLPYLKPGFLEKIVLRVETRNIDWSSFSIGMDKVALLDQWKQAEELQLYNPFDEFPMEYATNFKRFYFHLTADGEKFARIIEFLSKLHNFEQCTLSCIKFSLNPDTNYQFLGTPVSSNASDEVFHHPIPDSNYYFEIKKAKNPESESFDEVKIVKKKRDGS